MNEEKWIGWDKSVTIRKFIELVQPITLLSEWGEEIAPEITPEPPKPAGCFLFDDGTTQNWVLDQLYETTSKPQKKLTPFTHPTTGQFFGFVLSNSQNLALAASAMPLVIADPNVKQCDIYLESPDLSLNPNWQNIVGYCIDLYRTVTSPCGESTNPSFFAQLQLRVVDTSNKPHLFVEWDATKKDYILHPIKLLTHYHFTWKPSFLINTKYKVQKIRIRLTMPNLTGYGAGECAIAGKWLIGNVCPEK